MPTLDASNDAQSMATAKKISPQGVLLIGIGARFIRDEAGQLWIESQTISGLKAWAMHFERLIVFSICDEGPPRPGWLNAAEEGVEPPRFELIQIPDTYRMRSILLGRKAVEEKLSSAIGAADYRVFSYGGALGCPGELASSIARRHGHRYAIWLDRVESHVVRESAGDSLKSKAKALVQSSIISFYEKNAVRKADLSMLHGQTVYDYFRKTARNAVIVENVHYTAEDRITSPALQDKLNGCQHGPLRIIYVGRAAPMKGGAQWIETLGMLKSKGVDFFAEWFGDGPDLDTLKRMAAQKRLSDSELVFHGFVSKREVIKKAYQQAHIQMFCHLSNESPRNLIESLHAATPLVGYDDPFSRGLVNERGAGVLVPRRQPVKLADAVEALASDRARLEDLIRRASASASHLTRDAVFEERSRMVKEHFRA